MEEGVNLYFHCFLLCSLYILQCLMDLGECKSVIRVNVAVGPEVRKSEIMSVGMFYTYVCSYTLLHAFVGCTFHNVLHIEYVYSGHKVCTCIL